MLCRPFLTLLQFKVSLFTFCNLSYLFDAYGISYHFYAGETQMYLNIFNTKAKMDFLVNNSNLWIFKINYQDLC